MNKGMNVFKGIGYLVLVLTFIVGESVFAVPGTITTLDVETDPGYSRESVANLDEVNCDCTWDYQAMRISGSGGFGGRGTTYWPHGSFGGNYGEMRFAAVCDGISAPVFAFCFDLDHGLEFANYWVKIDSATISDNLCSAAQLQAMAYLLAPMNAFQDDALQLAMWKLTSDKNPESSTQGTPYFCIPSPNPLYPNLAYPYINTVYSTNPVYNNAANALVLDALGKNVLMGCDRALGGDELALSSTPAVVGETESSVTFEARVIRGSRAIEVGNTDLAGIRILANYTIEGEATVYRELYTDATGYVSFDVTQPIDFDGVHYTYYPVTAEFCSNAAWPVEVRACGLEGKQSLVFGEPDTCCWEMEVPGDQWLPVELMAFHASNSHDGVDLMWTTASETSVDYWEIERSNSGSDDFSALARLEAQNNAFGGQYTYLDRQGVNGRSYEYRLVNVDLDGSRTVHPSVQSASYGQLGAADVNEYALSDAYPNPFNPSTSIAYTIPEAGLVTIKVYDVSGREVAVLVNGRQEAGRHSVTFDGTHLSSGTYFYQMTAADFSMTKRTMLLK
jgi:hypothetical protein